MIIKVIEKKRKPIIKMTLMTIIDDKLKMIHAQK